MARGQKKHLKRLAAPKNWMLDKMSGNWAPRPSQGPHKLTECLPLIVLLRNRLKYALNGSEVTSILKQRLVLVDGKVRTDPKYPSGLMDVISIPKTTENFRMIYDAKGRFNVHKITPEEAEFKLCKVKRVQLSHKGVQVLVTHDGRTIRYPDPLIKANDTIRFNINTGKITDFYKFETGNISMITGGHNIGRVGIITHREKHDGGFEIIHLRDSRKHTFSTRVGNVFVIGNAEVPAISLYKDAGIRLSILEEAEKRKN